MNQTQTASENSFKMKTSSSYIIPADFPDPDIIRVDDTYYMVSTTMHFMPGCVILRSHNLVDWEHAAYVYDELEATEKETLADNKGAYGKGMWAACIRYHKGKFYISFVANDTGKTYLFTSEKIEGPWQRSEIKGFFHDMSLLFDDDGRNYLVTLVLDILLYLVEGGVLAVDVDCLLRIVLVLVVDIREYLVGTIVYELEFQLFHIDIGGLLELEDTRVVEHERHASGGAEAAAVLGEVAADIGHGAVGVVGSSLDEDCYAVGAVTFVDGQSDVQQEPENTLV